MADANRLSLASLRQRIVLIGHLITDGDLIPHGDNFADAFWGERQTKEAKSQQRFNSTNSGGLSVQPATVRLSHQ
jgi:hypothetical protein